MFVGLQTSKDILYVAKLIDEDASRYLIKVNPNSSVSRPPVETREFWVEKDFFRPILMGKNVHRYEPVKTDRVVFFPYRTTNPSAAVPLSELAANYPLTYSFVLHYEAAFKSREKNKLATHADWHGYIYRKNLDKFDQEKLVSMEICSNHPNITIDQHRTCHSTVVYSFVKQAGATWSYQVFAAILNSKLFWWFLRNTGDTLMNDARRMKTNYVNPFPLPQNLSPLQQARITQLVSDLILEKANLNRTTIVAQFEDNIDREIYVAYGITAAEIQLVEGRTI